MKHVIPAAPPGDLLTIRVTAQRILAESEAPHLAGWSVRKLRRLDARSVTLELGSSDGGPAIVLEWTDHLGEAAPAFVTGAAFSVGYRRAPTAWDLDDADTPEGVKRAAVAACQALAGATRLVSLRGVAPNPTIPDREVTFDSPSFTSWLGSRLPLGGELCDGWRLAEVYPFGGEELCVSFEHATTAQAVRLKVRLRDDARPAAARTANLDVIYTLVFGEATDASRAAIHARLVAELGLVLDALDRRVRFVAVPASSGDGAAAPDEGGPPPAMNLAIPAPCHMECNFCSVREEVYPILDSNSAFVRELRRDIERAGARGTKVLRINGIEPLNAPYLFDLLALARQVGFEDFHLFSTCRPLARREFAERFIAAQPGRYRINVPIYGSSAALHDAVSGAPGAFDEMMQAVANVRELMDDRGTLIFTTVLVRQLLDDLVAIRDLVKPLARWWEVHLPFPNTSSKTDRYRDVSVRYSDALARIYPEGWWPLADLPLGEILPCVALAHQRRSGHELITARRLADRMREPAGTFYRSAGFEHSMGGDTAVAFTASTVACPHRDGCALRAACPAEVYGLYAEQYGLDELAPVTRDELRSLADGDEVLRLLSG